MVLHLTTKGEGGFGVIFNDITEEAGFYTTTSRFVGWFGAFTQERQGLWLSKDDLQDSSWSSPTLVLLRDIHSQLITNIDFKDTTPLPVSDWHESSCWSQLTGRGCTAAGDRSSSYSTAYQTS
jgi:hypothetical protein